MKSYEINTAIAEIAGIVSKDQHGKLYHTEEGYVRDCPNYHGSLDAIVPVVRDKFKTNKEMAWYVFNLHLVVKGATEFDSYFAAADKWCEAYLRALQLWK